MPRLRWKFAAVVTTAAGLALTSCAAANTETIETLGAGRGCHTGSAAQFDTMAIVQHAPAPDSPHRLELVPRPKAETQAAAQTAPVMVMRWCSPNPSVRVQQLVTQLSSGRTCHQPPAHHADDYAITITPASEVNYTTALTARTAIKQGKAKAARWCREEPN